MLPIKEFRSAAEMTEFYNGNHSQWWRENKPATVAPEPEPDPVIMEPAVIAPAESAPEPVELPNFLSLRNTRYEEVSFCAAHDIIAATAKYFKVGKHEIIGIRRSMTLTLARHIAIFLTKKLTVRSFKSIAAVFGGRDHTSILHAVRRIQGLIDEGRKDVIDAISAIERKLGETKP